MKKIVLLAFVLVLLSTAFLISHTESEVKVERDLRIRVVDVAGNPVSNVKVLLIYVTEEGYWIHLPEEKVSDEGILECTVAEGNYNIALSCEDPIDNSPGMFEVTEDTEVLVTAYLLTMTLPNVYGVMEIDGIHIAIDMYSAMNVSVRVTNYYNTSKDVAVDIWILDSQSRRVSEALINTTIPRKTTYLKRITCSIALPPPTEGWVKDTYFLHAKIYDEQVVYREKSSPPIIIIKDRTVVPFWMQWWFWTIVIAGIAVLAGAVYFLKKRKPPTPTPPTLPTEGTSENTTQNTNPLNSYSLSPFSNEHGF